MTSMMRRKLLTALGAVTLGRALPALATGLQAERATAGADTLPGRLAFAHYMTAGVRSFDNQPAPDYYDTGYLDPDGEGGIHSSYGGFSRNRPTYRPPITAPAGSTWQIEDAKAEVAAARAAGLDGFAMLMPNYTGVHIARMDAMWEGAVRQDPTFLIRLMPDCAMFTKTTPVTQAQFVELIKRYAAKPNTMRLADGRVVLSPYRAEAMPVAWWQSTIDLLGTTTMNADGTTAGPVSIAFVPIMLSYTNAFYAMPDTYGVGVWGSRSPASTDPNTSGQLAQAASAHGAGKLWVQNVALQDVRPYSKIFDEALGTLTLVNTTQLAFNTNADWVDLDTWNDPAEHTGFYPSRNFGTLALELWRRLGCKWRTGSDWTPDGSMFVMHRPHFCADSPSWPGYGAPPNPNMMALRTGSSPAADIIDVTSWFTAPTLVTVQANGATIDAYTAPTGYFRHTAPLAAGAISVTAVGSAAPLTVGTPTAVVHQPLVQDMTYWGAFGTF